MLVDPVAKLWHVPASWLTDVLADTGDITLLEVLRLLAEDPSIKVDCRSDEVDMLLEVAWQAVAVTGDVRSSRRVLVDVVVGLEQVLGFVNSSIEVEPVSALSVLNALQRDTSGGEPFLDGSDRFLAM